MLNNFFSRTSWKFYVSNFNNNDDDQIMKRFKWWVAECIASLIVIFSYVAYKDIRKAGSGDDFNQEDYWVFYNSVFSVFLSLLGVAACIFPQEHNVCRLESILVWLVVICWSTTAIVAIVGPYTPSEQLLTNYRFSKLNSGDREKENSIFDYVSISHYFLHF